MKWRLNGIMAAVLVLFGALFWNIYHLQIENGKVYAARAGSQNDPSVLEPRRGSIFFTDKFGNRIPAAIDREYPTVFAVPTDITDPPATTDQLAALLEIDRAAVLAKLRKPDDEYELITPKAAEEVAQAIREAHLKGIYIGRTNARFYPSGSLASHLLGFLGSADDGTFKGRYGLELFYDDELRGVRGIAEGARTKPVDGKDLFLTIDRNIQAQAEEILDRVAEKVNAESGTVIVEEPKTGAILAMGSYPRFDPNEYPTYSVRTFLNPAVQAIYEPGSIAKVLTMSAALDTGAVTPETTFTDTGSLTLNQKTIRDWDKKAHGTVTMTEVIEQSLNLGAAFAAKTMGYGRFAEYLAKFGVDEKTGIELPGEVRGSLKSVAAGAREIHFATASFGQGIAVTPLALASMISAIANKGVLMKPTLIAGKEPTEVRRVISEQSAAEITAMMISAVRKAKVADIPHYRVAGKTGTAQIPDFKKGGYTKKFIHSYAGFAPVADPRFVILFKMDKPNVELAGATVVPAFKELAQFLLNYYHIPPDDLDAATSH